MYRSRSPHPALRAHVRAYWSYRGYAPEHAMDRVVPNGAVEIVMSTGERPLCWKEKAGEMQRSHQTLVQGPRMTAFDVPTRTQAELVGVHFVPGGAWPLLGVPLAEIAGQHIPLVNLVGSSANARVWEGGEPLSVDRRWSAFDAFFLARLRPPPTPPSALTWLHQASSVGEAVQHSGMSHRAFIATTRRELGLRPRDFLRIRRLNAALELWARGSHAAAAVAHQVGYADQSHWILECQKLLGMTPGELRRSRGAAEVVPPEEGGQMLPIL